MSEMSSENFREILKNDGYTYVLTAKSTEPIDINFPNMPNWYKDEWEEWCRDSLPDVDVIHFEYKGSSYKLLRNAGDPYCNEGNFGALFDSNDDKILDVISNGDMETTLHSLKSNETKIDDDLLAKVSPYFQYIEVFLHNSTEFEYLVCKVLIENELLYHIDDIDGRLVWKGDEVEERNDEE